MKKWYEKNYVDRRIWLLENLNLLKLDPEEFLLLTMIDFLHQTDQEISLDLLSKKCGMSKELTDKTVSDLSKKGYLRVKTTSHKVEFDITPVFSQEELLSDEISCLKLFENSFGRPLTQKEVVKLADWQQDHTDDELIEALRQATIYQKMSFAYIEKVLKNKNEE